MARKDRQAVTEGLESVFRSGGDDLLSGVIRRDRERSGRDAASTPGGPPSSESPSLLAATEPEPDESRSVEGAVGQYDIMTSLSYDNMTSHKTSQQSDRPSGKQTSGGRRRQAELPRLDMLVERRAEAKARASSPTTTVTLRLPRDLNDWLDEYVHRAWPQRVRKQELVVEALRMLFARRGRAGERIFETELLPEKDA